MRAATVLATCVLGALLARPEILMLDEPTQGLDQPGTAAFYRLVEERLDGLSDALRP